VFTASVRSGFLTAVALLAALLLVPAAASAASAPPDTTIAKDGPDGRYLMNGSWSFRRSRSGPWSKVTVPNAWNANDLSNASMGGSTVWYRKDFSLPSGSASDWKIRFESVRLRSRVWLNGKFIGSHEGAYLPWELHLKGLRRGTNRLVVEVENRQKITDLPPGKLTIVGAPSGGWWNWGGILGDVYLRKVDGIDIEDAQVLPRLPCRTCAARIDYRVTVRNYRRRAANVRLTTKYGDVSARIGAGKVAGRGASKRFSGSLRIAKPELWSPADPHLYDVSIAASGGGSASWSLHSGIRAITVEGGRLMLNYRPTNFRGGFLHEDDPVTAGAMYPERMDLFVSLAKQLGATVLRTHYPLTPYLHEQADRQGLMIWNEVPVFQMYTSALGSGAVRRKAVNMVKRNVISNGNHPSVLTWSIGNELAAEPTRIERNYFNRAARNVRELDPTRPVAYAIQGYPLVGCLDKDYKAIQLLGVNAYFGWYPGPDGSIADRTKLSAYLDQVRKCYPDKAIAVTEFGAEANRSGPEEDRGTYEFQADLNDYELGIFAQKPWLSGAIGMLIEFRVRPGWSGGNPFPSADPIHQKAVFDFSGNPKPAAQRPWPWPAPHSPPRRARTPPTCPPRPSTGRAPTSSASPTSTCRATAPAGSATSSATGSTSTSSPRGSTRACRSRPSASTSASSAARSRPTSRSRTITAPWPSG
jgi:beta-glucuronidase